MTSTSRTNSHPASPNIGDASPLDFSMAWNAAMPYLLDAWERTVLYADIRRRRGNQYRQHLTEALPNVLDFEAELVMSGIDLPQPTNYVLMRIVPGPDVTLAPDKRPFIVVDPRAGHGPGIGGFKPDSEIGAAFKAGHPCYFIGFYPDPVHGQTVEDVMRSEAAFVRKVSELHSHCVGKPVVVANCQAGWQILMTAAVWPELFGPIIVAGAPVSYWAGDNPMRYAGGLLGGSWLTALTSDLGVGRFDGAWLVQNFENLDPANTLWTKQYNVYANVDTEGPRYLGFEKYWGGHVFLEGDEMQYIVDNLFIGNRLSTAQLCTTDGTRIDLRNIRSPIVVFCSYGDNITPPGQALGWITDLYRDDNDVVGHDQTIVFATHESIGHLGIFVSGSVGRKEHSEFAANIDVIDMLPAGLYRAEVDERPDSANLPPQDEYLMRIRRSGIDEVRAIVAPDPRSERRFSAAAHVSEINLALYRNSLQPWVRAFATPLAAKWQQAWQPVRVGYEWWSDAHPLAAWVANTAERVRSSRHPVDLNNPFLQTQARFSDAVVHLLNQYRDHRDEIYALCFDMIYGAPSVQALAGQAIQDNAPVRPSPGDTPEHTQFLSERAAWLDAHMREGGPVEAVLRAMLFVVDVRGEADERHFRFAASLLRQRSDLLSDRAALRERVRTQSLLMLRDPEAAVAAIPHLLEGASAERIARDSQAIRDILAQGDELSTQEQDKLTQVLRLFAAAAKHAPAVKTVVPKASGSPISPSLAPPRRPSPKVSAASRTQTSKTQSKSKTPSTASKHPPSNRRKPGAKR